MPDSSATDAPDDGGTDDRRARKPFLLRLPRPLHDELRRWADDELRSLNGHIEYLLRQAVRARSGRTGPDPPAGDAPGGR